MKASKRLALWVILALLLPSLGLAHSGRTDSNGGHYNRRTGEYHFHNGGSAARSPRVGHTVDSRETKSQAVYVTRTGHKYHRDGCRHLKSKIPISLADARVSYSPCKVCTPPL
ncbi:YHYH domain-containing protein [Geobacter pelophilus]|uniref:YHYH domain-containing protein n=1 Tax=Geoanaerobacter pelophilus TaxID=60036 RepID=A0AAW4L4L7_9BACT|nr:YHYH domain-containing protein [Geoanaerobacter pelophilus]